MESKKQLMEFVSRTGGSRREYLLALFRCMPEEAAKEMIYLSAKKNDFIVLAGEPNESVFFILQGQVIGINYQKMGRVYSFMDFTKMYVIGDFEIFGESTEYGLTIKAAEECRLLKISSQSYLNWIRHDENALFLRLNHMITTLAFERQIDWEFLLMNCRERLASFLVKYYEKSKKDPSGKVRVGLTQAGLSDKVGFNIRSVQRSIAALEKEELLSNENGKITISYEQYLGLSGL